MDTLGSFKDCGYFTGNAVDMNLIQFCFSMLVQVRKKTNRKNNTFLISKQGIVASQNIVSISFYMVEWK